MLKLEERVEVVEDKVDRLESLFGQFMAQTGRLINRLERQLEQRAVQIEQQAERDRQQWQEHLKQSDERWEKQLAEMDQRWEKQRAESDQRWEKQRAEDRQQLAEMDQRLEKQRAEDHQRLAEMDQRWEKQRAEDRQHWNKRWGELAQKMGTIAEDIVAPNLPRIARVHFGCQDLEDFMVRRKVKNKQDPSKRREFDVIAVCADKVLINETKSTPSVEAINDFVKALAEVTAYFPEYQGKTIIPIFASLYLDDDLVNYLTKKRIYALAMGDETMELLNGQRLTLTEQRS
jgi:translation elongation factor EF-G